LQNKWRYITDYFNLSRREQRGIIVLFLILLFIIASKFLIPFIVENKKIDTATFEAKVLEFQKKQNQYTDSLQNIKNTRFTAQSQLSPFEFDPNNLSIQNWKKLGLTDQQISNIKNYEAKGGKFYQADDLSKIYSISKEEYNILKPYIKIKTEQPETFQIDAPTINPRPFNPNTAVAEDFNEMNLPQNLTNAILNYRSKGGSFKIKEDLKTIYVLKEEDYKVLEPFIQLPDQIEFTPEPEISLSIEINSADTLDLQQIPGIGPSFASRIVKYRNLLGGFSDPHQLLEVYGMDSSRYNTIRKNITIDKSNISKININSSPVKGFIKHPYFEFYLAKSIISYREENGNFTNIEEVKKVKLIYDELFEKIKPYITIKEP
jgi:competence ComEA-like helix-hairpin-helix protein